MTARMILAAGFLLFATVTVQADPYLDSLSESVEEESGAVPEFLSTAQGVPPAPSGGPSGYSAPAMSAAPAAPKAPPKPFKPLFFDNDFSYARQPDHPHVWGEELKEMPFCGDCDDSWISFGGELRYRYMDEDNRLRPGGPGRSTYDLWRWRNYVDARFSKSFRVYVEMIDASIFDNELPVTGIDKNRWDLQNYFFDLQVGELGEQPVFFRYGRQELLYGNQRLVSPLDWANTRRNFEGFKLFSKGRPGTSTPLP